ncbi:hypothetical protein LUZ60_001045 [Juncus effusus]|nr:hypothetical protein LUZ60_001045 [Juncus effusus]
MEKLPPLSQIIKTTFLLFFILLTPFIPISLKPPYLYILFNIIVLVLGIESGFLKAITGPHDDKKSFHFPPPCVNNPNNDAHKISTSMSTTVNPTIISRQPSTKKPDQKAKVGALLGPGSKKFRAKKLKKCPSRPTIFFIAGSESDGEFIDKKNNIYDEEEKEEWMEVEEMMSKQELFAKAESFIGNFYNQLQMQRKESWNKIHELYHTAF